MKHFKEFLQQETKVTKPISEAEECHYCEYDDVATTVQCCIIEPIGSLVKKLVTRKKIDWSAVCGEAEVASAWSEAQQQAMKSQTHNMAYVDNYIIEQGVSMIKQKLSAAEYSKFKDSAATVLGLNLI